METLERLQQRLDTGEDLTAVVRTMKALALASIQQYERAVHTLATYARTVNLGLHVLLRDAPRPEPASGAGAAALIVFGSDHGLCGRFNEAVGDVVAEAVRARRPARVLAVGARVVLPLERAGLVPEAVLPLPASAARITHTVRRLLVRMDAWRAEGIEGVQVARHTHLGRTRSEPALRTLLPLDMAQLGDLGAARWASRSIPTYSMPRGDLLAALVRQHLFVQLFRACAESLASEHGARLVAMQAAEQNLRDRQAELTQRHRRRRQERITAELLDVIAGYEALMPDAQRGR